MLCVGSLRGDGLISDWTSWAPIPDTVELDHSYTQVGTYYVTAQAKDIHGDTSQWSAEHEIVISQSVQNHAPETPSSPSGPSSGYEDTLYYFSSQTTDPDTDSVAYRFAWGDGNISGWSDWVPSGNTVTMSHSWDNEGTYYVKAQAKDIHGDTSGWSAGHRIDISHLNRPPNKPSNPSPADGDTSQSVNISLSWSGGDPDSGDWVVYDVYFEANDSTPDSLVSDDQSDTTYDPGALWYGTHYYWQVIAIDNHGDSTIGPVWDFTTSNPPGTWVTYSTSNSGLADNIVKDIAVDTHGNLWFATMGGLSKFDGVSWTRYDSSDDSLPCNRVNSVAITPSGDVWIGVEGHTGPLPPYGHILCACRFDGNTWTIYDSSNSDIPHWPIESIAVDSSGNVWFATYGGGAAKFDGDAWTNYNSSNSGIACDVLLAVASSPSGDLWFGTSLCGTSRFDGTEWTTYTVVDSFDVRQCGDFAFDAAKNVWLALWDWGLGKFDGSDWSRYHRDNSGLSCNWAGRIAIDVQDNKWIGSWKSGVFVFDGTAWINYNTSNSGIVDNSITAIAFDHSGNVWFGTLNGVSKLVRSP